jgi:methionyl-tRNA formyltransferase
VVFGAGKISSDVIKMFPDGLINVHRGISEKYRGLDSELWAVYHQDYGNIGVTIHKVEELLDTGDIIFKQKLKLKSGMKTYQLRYYTSLIATNLVIKTLKDYLSGTLLQKKQKKKGRYYSFMPLELKKIVNDKFNHYCEKIIK